MCSPCTSTPMSQLPFDYCIELINKWIKEFQEFINKKENSETHFIFVAISRKMPRFIDWLHKNRSLFADAIKEGSPKNLFDILEGSVITTEISLPFISKSITDKDEIIVIDDTIVLGNTMRRVSSDVYTYLGKKPVITAIMSNADFQKDLMYISESILPTSVYGTSILEAWIKFVSQCNLATSLPIDVEFPILCIGNLSTQDIKKRIDGYADKKYDIIHTFENENNSSQSFSILLDSDRKDGYNIDFSKIRFFKTNDTVKAAIFCPLYLKQSAMKQPDLFQEEAFKEIFEKILSYFDDRTDNSYRGFQSLAVAINYVHSLSRFNQDIVSAIGNDANIHLDKDDLILIFGKELAEELLPLLNRILHEQLSITLPIGRQAIANMVVPAEFADSYDEHRRFTVANHLDKTEIDDILEDVFNLSKFPEGIIDRTHSVFHLMHSAIFESFDSLIELLSAFTVSTDSEIEVNKWIDTKIDEGIIIPRYVPVTVDSGEVYWRRFFMNSYSSIEL